MTNREFREVLEDRTARYAVDVFKFLRSLPCDVSVKIISYQLGKSASSIGANYHEANKAESKDDFVHKISIALKEANESLYWFKDVEGLLDFDVNVENLKNETIELRNILQSILKGSKRINSKLPHSKLSTPPSLTPNSITPHYSLMPYFSIIIPVYNVAQYLRECLDSVLAQTFTDWEAICVDDGSTDESGAILDEYAAKDKRFRVIHQANAGVSAARNAALDEVKGEWICFLDSDDKWVSSILSSIKNAIQPYDDILIVSILPVINFFEESGDVSICGGENIPSGIIESDYVFMNEDDGPCKGMGWFAWDKVFKRDLVSRNRLRFLEGLSNGEDSLFAHQAMMLAGKILSCPNIKGYYYRIRNSSATRNRSLKSFIDQIYKAERFYSLYTVSKKEGIRKIILREFVYLFALGVRSKYRKDCIQAFLESEFVYNVVLGFVIKNGTLRLRLLAILLMISPKKIASWLLERKR